MISLNKLLVVFLLSFFCPNTGTLLTSVVSVDDDVEELQNSDKRPRYAVFTHTTFATLLLWQIRKRKEPIFPFALSAGSQAQRCISHEAFTTVVSEEHPVK